MTANELDAIRWELTRRLEGMREPANHDHGSRWEPGDAGSDDYRQIYLSCAEAGCPGYQPVPLTAEGLLDEGRLRRAIEAEGFAVTRAQMGDGPYTWGVYGEAYGQGGYDPDLAVAYLKAVGAWPLKEGAHA